MKNNKTKIRSVKEMKPTKTTTLLIRNSVNYAPLRRGFLLIALALASFAFSPAAHALSPPPDGGYPNGNTAEGDGALFNLTTGSNNTAIGFNALETLQTSSGNTAIGVGALFSNTSGGANTAVGYVALSSNMSGGANTAVGYGALDSNMIGGANTAIGFNALSTNNANNNTATGFDALLSNSAGNNNTATGYVALEFNDVGSQNTATGVAALQDNDGNNNTATGFGALLSNSNGNLNTANGAYALQNNNADFNTADGVAALFNNTTGIENTANGVNALFTNTSGNNNTATGVNALLNNNGSSNVADGFQALNNNSSGNNNTANGVQALFKNNGSGNIALGASAGFNLTTGNNNIDIGNVGVAGEAAKIRIGTVGTQNGTFIAGIRGVTVAGGVGVIVGTNGRLGTTASSARFKEAIKPMDKASEAILALKPVTFRYKHELDPEGIPQFGLVAEEVEKVNPDLVARDAKGEVYTVRYEAVNAMLLNEFLKEHRTVQEQQATIAQLKKEMETVVARLREQDTKIQKVSDRLELNKPVPNVVSNDQ